MARFPCGRRVLVPLSRLSRVPVVFGERLVPLRPGVTRWLSTAGDPVADGVGVTWLRCSPAATRLVPPLTSTSWTGGRPACQRVRAGREQAVNGPAPAPGIPGIATRLLLEDYAAAGEAAAGLALAGEAFGMGRGAQLWEAGIRRLRAVFRAAPGARPGEITAELEQALAVARHRHAPAFAQRIGENARGTPARTGPEPVKQRRYGRTREEP